MQFIPSVEKYFKNLNASLPVFTDVNKKLTTTPPTITRRIFITPGAMNSPGRARSVNTSWDAFVFPNAVDDFCAGQLIVPSDYLSNMNMYIWWGGNNAGDCFWYSNSTSGAHGEAYASPGWSLSGAKTLSVGVWNRHSLGAISGIAGGDILGVHVGRIGTHVADTIVADVWLNGIEFTYIASS